MVVYVPGVEETDQKKQNRSLQQIGAAATANAANVAVNTSNIATNTSDITALQNSRVSYASAQGKSAVEQRQARNNIGVGPNSTVSANQVFAGPSSGAAADPAFRALVGAESALVLLGSATASSSASISFTGLVGASYSQYILYIDSVTPATNAVDLNLQVSTGSGFLTSGYRHGTWRWTNAGSGTGGSTADSRWVISSASETLGTGANQVTGYVVNIFAPDSTDFRRRATWTASGLWASNTFVYMTGAGEVDTNAAVIDGIKLACSSGNIATGSFRLYGVRNA